MDRLRPRERNVFSGFTKAEIEKMEKLHKESGEQSLDQEFCRKLAHNFNSSEGCAGKPPVKWTEVESWFQNRQQNCPSKDVSSPNPPAKLSIVPETCAANKGHKSSRMSKGASVAEENVPDLSELEFEARSTKDGASYDVDSFLTHRFLLSGEAEVRVRFVGFGAEEDEWLNVRKAVRERSLQLDHSECQKVRIGDLVLCFQERIDQARL